MPDVDDVTVRLKGEAGGALNASSQVVSSLLSIQSAAAKASIGIAAVSAVASATVGVMFNLAKSAAAVGTQLFNDSQKYAQHVEFLAGIQYAAGTAGVAYGSLAVGLRTLSRNLEATAQGSDEQAGAFLRLGVSALDAAGKARPANAVLLDLADKFKTMPDSTEKTALAMRVFGRAGSELIPFLNKGSEGIGKLTDEAQRLGLVMSKEQTVAAERFSSGLDRIEAASRGLKITIGNALIPEIQKLIDWWEKGSISAADKFANAIERTKQAAASGSKGFIGGTGLFGMVAIPAASALGGASKDLSESYIAAQQLAAMDRAKEKWKESVAVARDRHAAETALAAALGVSLEALMKMTGAEQGALVVKASLAGTLGDLTRGNEAYARILEDEADVLLKTAQVESGHLQLKHDEEVATRGLAAATSLLTSARAGLAGITGRAFDRELAGL